MLIFCLLCIDSMFVFVNVCVTCCLTDCRVQGRGCAVGTATRMSDRTLVSVRRSSHDRPELAGTPVLSWTPP
jgi:hypothetical protein